MMGAVAARQLSHDNQLFSSEELVLPCFDSTRCLPPYMERRYNSVQGTDLKTQQASLLSRSQVTGDTCTSSQLLENS
jgi:hypothetical protein